MIDVSVPVVSTVELIRKSTAHYNHRNPSQPIDPTALTADPRLFARLAVNWLRHECSNYDNNRDLLRRMTSRDVREDVGATIKGRTLAAIAAAYPHLREEARRQAQRTDRLSAAPRNRTGRRRR